MIQRTFTTCTKVMLSVALGLLLLLTTQCSIYQSVLCYLGYSPYCNGDMPDPKLYLLGPVPIPPDNSQSPEKVKLGEKLFSDGLLSKDGTVSCASCHRAENWFADTPNQFSKGVGGTIGTRNSPTVLNAAYNHRQFWNGRAESPDPAHPEKSLEEQAVFPIKDPNEMAETLDNVVKKLKNHNEYPKLFKTAFSTEGISVDRIKMAIAAFERTLISNNSPFDRWVKKEAGLSETARRGWKLFEGKANCIICHRPPTYNDNEFHSIGVPQGSNPDPGRVENDRCVGFKTPTLRNVEKTAPYMHNGELTALEKVVNFYNEGGGPVPKGCTKPPFIRPLGLNDQEKKDLEEFLMSLTGTVPPDSLP